MQVTLGVEEEFLLVDSGSCELVPRADLVFPRAREILDGAVATELNLCQIETDTRVCESLGDVRRELVRLRRGLAEAAAAETTEIAATGTHPFSRWEDQQVDTSRRRYARMEEEYQLVAREQIICGCHVHVGLGDPEVVAVMQRTRPWLPILLALSANSPFWQGEDTGYDSYRLQVWRRWPTAGMPPILSDRPEFDRLVEEMQSAGAISDPTHLYWFVRPSARFPTLEFRVCDVCLGVDDTVAVAGIVRALAWTCAQEGPEAPEAADDQRREILNAAMWRASRFGLGESLLHPVELEPRPAGEVVNFLLDSIRPGLEEHGDWDEVSSLTRRILVDGNGASRQRSAFRDGDGKAVAAYVTRETLPDPG